MKNYGSILALGIMLLASCQKHFENQIGENFHFLGPLINSRLTMEDVAEAGAASINQRITPADLSITTGDKVIITSFQGMTVSTAISNELQNFQSITFNSITLDLKINNQFPFTFREGTILKWMNASDNSQVFSIPLTEDLPEMNTYEVTVTATNGMFETDGYLTLENLGVYGTLTPVSIHPSVNYLSINIKAHFDDVEEVVIQDLPMIEAGDTTQYHSTISNDITFDGNGTMTVYATNYFPADIEVEFYMLNDNYKVIDSFFTDSEIPAAIYNQSGGLISYGEAIMMVEVSNQDLRNLERATYIVTNSVFRFSQSGQVTITDDHYLDLQIVGDFKADIN